MATPRSPRPAAAAAQILAVAFSLVGSSLLAGPASVYPGKEWAHKKPAATGMNAKALEAFSKYVGGRGCIVRHGYMVYAWGDQSRRADVASACKPLYTHFLLVAIEKGKIGGFDEKITRWEPRLKSLNAKLGHKDRRITWRHLANQISCYGVREKPGEAYDYNDYNMALLFDTLFLKVYGSSWKTVDRDVLHSLLTGPIQCQDTPTFMAFGTGNRPGRFGVSVRDFARFGLLYLRQGKWKGKQLIRAENAGMVVSRPLPNSIPRTAGKDSELIPQQRSLGGGKNQTDHMGSYSFAWWLNGVDRDGKRHWPAAPQDAYGAFGHGGPRAMIVIGSIDLIVSWNDTRVKSREMENRALELLMHAVKVK